MGIDPGSVICGITVLKDGQIDCALNVERGRFWDKITTIMLNRNVICVVEDVRAYSDRLKPGVMDTLKMIGEIIYGLKIHVSCDCRLVTRSEVRKWVFDRFPAICIPEIQVKIDKKSFDACDLATKQEIRVTTDGRKPKTPYFVYVDDAIVKKCMTNYYKIPKPGPGEGYKFGLKDHSFQSLALCAFFEETLRIDAPF